MSLKPKNFQWIGFTNEQAELLDFLDHVGNNGWDSNGQSDALMPNLLSECADAGLTLPQILRAMQDIGYSRRTVHQLERWENKRLIGKFGK